MAVSEGKRAYVPLSPTI